jgi:hypothetical protein
MKESMKIYKIQSSAEFRGSFSPIYEDRMQNAPSWCLKFGKPLFENLKYSGVEDYLELWKRGTVADQNEIPRLENLPICDMRSDLVFNLFILNEKAYSKLKIFLRKYGEFSKIDFVEGYHFFFCNNLKDYVDENYSAKKTFRPNLDWYAFIQSEHLDDVFITKYESHSCFCTETFKTFYQSELLTGLDFLLIWDSENSDYVDERFKPEVWAEIKSRHAKRN